MALGTKQYFWLHRQREVSKPDNTFEPEALLDCGPKIRESIVIS